MIINPIKYRLKQRVHAAARWQLAFCLATREKTGRVGSVMRSTLHTDLQQRLPLGSRPLWPIRNEGPVLPDFLLFL